MMIGLRSTNGAQGGVERHVRSLVEELDALGLATCVVERSPYSNEDGASIGLNSFIKVLWAPRSVRFETVVHSVIATLWAGWTRPRIVHIHAIGPSIVAPLARLLGLRVVCTHHGRDYDREKWSKVAKLILKAGEWCQARFANERICVGRTLSLQLRDELHAPFTYIPNAVKLPAQGGASDVLDRFALQPGKYIVNVGRLVPEKRQDHLIKAFAQLALKDIKLVLIGKADHESRYSHNLSTLANTTPGVVMAGFQGGSDLVQLLANAALFVLPSSHEGMPIAALEAMSLSRPVVLSDIPANLDLLLPPSCYHKTSSIEDLAETIRRNLPQEASSCSAVDWGEILSAFDWRNVAQKTLEVYSSASPQFSLVTHSVPRL